MWVAAPAHAWVQYLAGNTTGCGLRWYADATLTTPPVIPVQLDNRGLDGISTAQWQAALVTALDQWQSSTCTTASGTSKVGFSLQFAGAATPTVLGAGCSNATVPCTAKVNNGNFVRAVKTGEEWKQSTTIFALTTLTFDTCTGEIIDGDIELDDSHHDFCTDNCAPGQQSLCNTLSHETGHLLGLDHSAFAEATMDNSGPSGQTKKCTLHGDDRQAVCTTYATGCGRSHSCAATKATTTSGCAARPMANQRNTVSAMALLGVAAVWLLQRRRPRITP